MTFQHPYWLLLILLLGCKTPGERFQDFLKYADNISLPLVIGCEFIPEQEAQVLPKFFNDFLPPNAKVAGRLFAEDQFVYLLYAFPGDIIYPYLYIYNQEGVRLDSLYLHVKECSFSKRFELHSITTIYPSKLISMKDSTLVYQYVLKDSGYSKILSKTDVHSRNVMLNESGFFGEVLNIAMDTAKVYYLGEEENESQVDTVQAQDSLIANLDTQNESELTVKDEANEQVIEPIVNMNNEVKLPSSPSGKMIMAYSMSGEADSMFFFSNGDYLQITEKKMGGKPAWICKGTWKKNGDTVMVHFKEFISEIGKGLPDPEPIYGRTRMDHYPAYETRVEIVDMTDIHFWRRMQREMQNSKTFSHYKLGKNDARTYHDILDFESWKPGH